MVGNGRKKAGAVLCAALFAAYLALLPLLYLVIEVPGIVAAAISVVCLALIIALAWFTRQRIREIDEGLEDAVDNY